METNAQNGIAKKLTGKWAGLNSKDVLNGDTLILDKNSRYTWTKNNVVSKGSWGVYIVDEEPEIRMVSDDLKMEIYNLQIHGRKMTIKTYTSFPDKSNIIWHTYRFKKLR